MFTVVLHEDWRGCGGEAAPLRGVARLEQRGSSGDDCLSLTLFQMVCHVKARRLAGLWVVRVIAD